MKSSSKNIAVLLLFHLLLFGVLSQFVFSYNAGRLLPGNDGPMLWMLAHDKLRYIGQSFELHTNFLQGIGNLSFPLNPAVIPAFWFESYNASGLFNPASMFTCFALLTFVTIWLVGWNHGFSRNVRFAAAWVLTLLLFPYFKNYVAVYPVLAQAPIFVMYLFCGALADIALWRMGRSSAAATVAYAILLLLSIIIMLVVSPAALIIVAPYLAVSGIVALVAADKRGRIHKLVGGGAVLLIALVAGWVEYVAGLYLYSSGTFFFSEMLDSYPPSRQFGSILYQGRIADRAAGPFLLGLGTVGALWMLCRKDRKWGYAAAIMLAGAFLHGVVGAELIKRSGGWSGPPPIYSEMPFYALYALFAMSLFTRIRWKGCFSESRWAYGLPLVATILVGAITLCFPPEVARDINKHYPMPPSDNDVTRILQDSIGLPPGAVFSGRVATIIPAPQGWQGFYAHRLNVKLGNDMISNGLWLKDIPTLTEYNQLISPRFYLLIKNFLSDATIDPKQNRSWTNFSRIDISMLRLLGVRFVLSTEAYLDGLEKRAFLTPEGLEALRLYEVPEVNYKGISASRVQFVSSVNEAIDVMRRDDFMLDTAVMVSMPGQHMEEHITELSPVTGSRIAVKNGAYHIVAESKGKSLLILPIELSHCTDVTALSGDVPELLNVDVALTGVYFDRKLDISLVTRTGAFHNPRCRLKDYQQFKASYRSAS